MNYLDRYKVTEKKIEVESNVVGTAYLIHKEWEGKKINDNLIVKKT